MPAEIAKETGAVSKRILVVDDSLVARKQVATFLRNSGYEVDEAPNGAVALAMADKSTFDLLIVDVNMPVMDGLQMLEQLRQRQPYAATPVFVLTTESTTDMLGRGKSAGATAWVVKPFKQESLLRGIRNVLRS
jgi:two-component system chemotaxis response regulator CheY